MKLNPDCVRGILLSVEEYTDLTTKMLFHPARQGELERLRDYSADEVLYHIRQCELTGFLLNVEWNDGNVVSCIISDLSPLGHEFLANIRSDNVWAKTKESAKKIGSFSLDTLAKIAVNVISSFIKDNT